MLKNNVKVKDKKIIDIETFTGITRVEMFEGAQDNRPFIMLQFLNVIKHPEERITEEFELGGFMVRYQDDGIFYSLRSYPNEEEHNFEKVMDYNLFGDGAEMPKDLENEIKTISNEVAEHFDNFMVLLKEVYKSNPMNVKEIRTL